jgi:antitoxin FitA
MATLHDLDIPNDLYEQLQELAKAKNSSINAQVITLLQSALSEAQIQKTPEEQIQQDVAKLLEESRRRREQLPHDLEWSDSTAMIREDRDR